jgi:hypothetical protein
VDSEPRVIRMKRMKNERKKRKKRKKEGSPRYKYEKKVKGLTNPLRERGVVSNQLSSFFLIH